MLLTPPWDTLGPVFIAATKLGRWPTARAWGVFCSPTWPLSWSVMFLKAFGIEAAYKLSITQLQKFQSPELGKAAWIRVFEPLSRGEGGKG